MASTGMAPVIGTLPTPRRLTRGAFLESAEVLPLDGEAAVRWPGHGLKFQPWPCRGAYVDDSGCSPTMLTSDTPECEEYEEQLPFKMYDVLRYSAFSHIAEDPESFMRTRMGLLVSSLLAKELVDGAGSGGLSLSSEAHYAGGGAFSTTAVDLDDALAALEEDLASNLNGTQGMIHVPPGLMFEAVDKGQIEWTGSRYETPLGNIVVADAGYVGMAHPAGSSAAGAKKTWIYASGPVYYRTTGAEFMGDALDGGSFAMDRNTITRFIEAYGIILFDPCPVAAIVTHHDTTP